MNKGLCPNCYLSYILFPLTRRPSRYEKGVLPLGDTTPIIWYKKQKRLNYQWLVQPFQSYLLSSQTLKQSKIKFAVISVMRLQLIIHYDLDHYIKC